MGILLAACLAMSGGDTVVLVAGGDSSAGGAKLSQVFGVDFDRAGNMYLVEIDGSRLARIDPKGVFSVVAGSGIKGSKGGNGPALSAQFDGMHNLAVGPDGSVYLADTWNNRVCRVDVEKSVVTIFAGTGEIQDEG